MSRPITVFGMGDTGGCGYYRVGSPLYQLSKSPDFAVGYQLAEKFSIPEPMDILVMSRVPGHRPLLDYLTRVQARGTKLVYDLDDDLWAIDPDNTRAVEYYTPEILTGVMAMIQLADLVTVSTALLAQKLAPFARRIEVLPNLLPDSAFAPGLRPRRPRPVVGWAGGDSHRDDLAPVADTIHSAVRAAGAELHVMGYGQGNPLLRSGTRFTGWQGSVEDYYEGLDFDVALAPLRDTEFTRSKSAIKAMEAAAQGIPTIASAGPVYDQFVIDGFNGVRYERPHELRSAIRRLVADEDERHYLGANALDLALEYRESVRWTKRANLYRELMED